jgi:hypothetical protein
MVALKIFDKRENELPDVGLVKMKDAETGDIRWINTSSKKTRDQYNLNRKKAEAELKDIFNRSGVDAGYIDAGESYIKPLMTLFKKRGR